MLTRRIWSFCVNCYYYCTSESTELWRYINLRIIIIIIIIIINVVSICEPYNYGGLELSSLGVGGVADPKIHAPPACVTCGTLAFCVEGCSHRGEPPEFRIAAGAPLLAVGAWLTPRNYAPPHMCYPAEFGRTAQQYERH